MTAPPYEDDVDGVYIDEPASVLWRLQRVTSAV